MPDRIEVREIPVLGENAAPILCFVILAIDRLGFILNLLK